MADLKFSQAAQATTALAADLIGTTQAGLDKSATFALWGGLEIATWDADADQTGVSGMLYSASMATWSADRNLTLPTGKVGERIGVFVSGEPAGLQEAIIKGAAGVSISKWRG
jgi:hypothetical protein